MAITSPAMDRVTEYGVESVPDCLTFCAPGVAITVNLLIERILLRVSFNPGNSEEPEIKAEELYDCLITAESGPIDRFLFVSPHILFNREALQDSFQTQVQTIPFNTDRNSDWHLPMETEITDDLVTVRLHASDFEKEEVFHSFSGTVIQPRLLIPDQLSSDESLDVLSGLGRSVFECRFDRPIEIGKSIWIRLAIKPLQLIPPASLESPNDNSGVPFIPNCLIF